ncbi:MAG: dimethylsulfoniopropionate demethylase [Gammaproteobacteria bacterium]
MTSIPLSLSRRQRETPFEKRMLEHDPKGLAVYNHMTLPTVFESMEADYAHLCEHVQLWDVGCERQVEVVGPDALRLVELSTPRDMSSMAIGQGRYAPLVDEHGGVVNDPIILRLEEDRYWFSIADSDVQLWLKGLAYGMGLDVKVFEPDVSPLAVQGPKAVDLLAGLVGEHVRDIRFFHFIEEEIAGAPVLIARSGWSGQDGYEIYLQGSHYGSALWDAVFEAGQKHQIRAGCPNLIDRLEFGLISYGNDMTLAENPFECGLDKFFKLGKDATYLSQAALEQLHELPLKKKLVKIKINYDAPLSMRSIMPIRHEGREVGYVTTQTYSQKYGYILSIGYLDTSMLHESKQLEVVTDTGKRVSATYCSDSWPLS